MWRHLLDIMRTMFMFKTLVAIGAIVALGDQCATITATLTLYVSWRWVEGPRNLNRFHFSQMLKAWQKYLGSARFSGTLINKDVAFSTSHGVMSHSTSRTSPTPNSSPARLVSSRCPEWHHTSAWHHCEATSGTPLLRENPREPYLVITPQPTLRKNPPA